jgi:drug/metabolite transporter (DMT)-like permease
MMQVGVGPSKAGMLLAFVLRAFTNFRVLSGLACAVVAAVAWTIALSRSDLSFAYPFMGLAIVLTLALSAVLLREHVTMWRWLGVLVVCVGLWIAARG